MWDPEKTRRFCKTLPLLCFSAPERYNIAKYIFTSVHKSYFYFSFYPCVKLNVFHVERH